MIPKILFQTSREKPEPYVLGELSHFVGPGWEYRHFTDAEVFQYFERNKLPEYPGMFDKFRQMPWGGSAADLFRYYHLYVDGGVFIDSDAMLKAPIDSIVAGVDFFSVRGGYLPGSIFQGFIGCTRGHPLIRMALEDAYHIDVNKFRKNYHLLCINLFDIVAQHGKDYNMKLFEEVVLNNGACEILDENDRIVLMHYFKDKIIPRRTGDSRTTINVPTSSDPQEVILRIFALAKAGKLPPEVRAMTIEKLRASGNQGLLDAFLAVLDVAA